MKKVDYSIGEIVPYDEGRIGLPDEHYAYEMARLISKVVRQVVHVGVDDLAAYGRGASNAGNDSLKFTRPVIDRALLILYYNDRRIFQALRDSGVDASIETAEKAARKLSKVFQLRGSVQVDDPQGGILTLRLL
jgi:hypothetical protein